MFTQIQGQWGKGDWREVSQMYDFVYKYSFRKFQSVIQYPGKSRAQPTQFFVKDILDASSVVLFVKYEQVCQISDQGVKKWTK